MVVNKAIIYWHIYIELSHRKCYECQRFGNINRLNWSFIYNDLFNGSADVSLTFDVIHNADSCLYHFVYLETSFKLWSIYAHTHTHTHTHTLRTICKYQHTPILLSYLLKRMCCSLNIVLLGDLIEIYISRQWSRQCFTFHSVLLV